MPQRSSKNKPRLPDPNALAFAIVQGMTGEPPAPELEQPPDPAKNPHAVALGKLGGAKGGKARASKLPASVRSQIAQKAATARWAKKVKSSQKD